MRQRRVKPLKRYCSETTLTGESRFHISPPRGFEPVTLVAGSKQVSPLDQWDMVRIMWDCRLFTGLPPSSRLCRLWSQKGDLQRAWNQARKAVWDQVGLSHCRHDGLVTVGDEALLMINHVGGHQCSETTLTGESWFHINPPRGFEPVTLVAGSKQVSPLDQWDMVRIMWDCWLYTILFIIYKLVLRTCTLLKVTNIIHQA